MKKDKTATSAVSGGGSLASTTPPHAFAGVLTALVMVVLLLHLPSLRLPHIEGDEVIFTFLAERLASDPRAYHLQGALEGPPARRFIADTWARLYVAPANDPRQAQLAAYFAAKDEAAVLYQPVGPPGRYAYDPAIYDRPMFFHPPVYPYTLAAFRAALGSAGGPLLSMLCHVGTIILVALLGRTWAGDRVGLIAAALVAFDPVSWLAGSRLWIDGVSELAATGAVLAAVWARRHGTVVAHVVAGATLGLAAWTKLPALVVAPAVAMVTLEPPREGRAAAFAALVGTAAVLLLAWLAIVRLGYGAWLPVDRPTSWIIEDRPYLRLTVGRPWHFYLTGLLLVAPIYLYAFPGLGNLRREPWLRVPAVWVAFGGLALTGLALAGVGGGYQLRYLAPVVPGVCLLTAVGIARLPWWWAAPAVVLGAATFTTAFWGGVQVGTADPLPIVVLWYGEGLGLGLRDMFPGMW